jgi:hypothetical protein
MLSRGQRIQAERANRITQWAQRKRHGPVSFAEALRGSPRQVGKELSKLYRNR